MIRHEGLEMMRNSHNLPMTVSLLLGMFALTQCSDEVEGPARATEGTGSNPTTGVTTSGTDASSTTTMGGADTGHHDGTMTATGSLGTTAATGSDTQAATSDATTTQSSESDGSGSTSSGEDETDSTTEDDDPRPPIRVRPVRPRPSFVGMAT